MRGKVALLIAVPLLLTACTSNTPSEDQSPPSNRTPVRLSPHVEKPLDVAAFADDPCTSLTEAQQQEFGLPSGTTVDQPDGYSCAFRDPQDANQLLATVFYSDRPTGLDHLYGMNKGGAWSHWQPMEVDGYPAVAYANRDHPSLCDVAVGVADSVYISAGAGDDGCPAAEKMAAAVLSTIKAGQ